MASYLGQVETLKDEFNSLMPFIDSVTKMQRDKFFIVLALIGLRSNLDSVRDQILISPVIPTFEDVSAKLLCISLSQNNPTESESSVLAVRNDNQKGTGGYRKSKVKKSYCTYCDKSGHTRDICWILHGCPPRTNQSNNVRSTAHIIQSNANGLLPLPDAKEGAPDSITLTRANYKEYLQYQTTEQQQSSSSSTSHSGTDALSDDSHPIAPSPTLVMPSAEAVTPPIALRKGIQSSRNPYLIYNFVSYHRLSPSYYAFVSNMSNVFIPKTVREALDHPRW
ncbi:uncharacterized protein LOC131177958 [Hevea brasiliensis]|uniref:uncharacterized protein LOC131177958 n=1 Tax=Hevea brasiliensis TaxID=3981 RepID=UPI0025FF7369|nr:uncharacterized protein LOC131177958 [Hevea brasiliensis]